MPEYHQWRKKNNQVHCDVESLCSKEKRGTVDTLGAGVFWIPLCRKWHAAHHGGDLHGEVARNNNGNDGEAKPLFPRQRRDARVL